MKKVLLLLITLGLTLLLPACWNAKDIQNMAYVTALGLDYQDGKYISYVQVLNFANVARTDTSQLGKTIPVWIGKGEGKTVTESFNSIYSTSQIRVFWGHVRTIVCSESLLSNPQRIKEAYDMVNRYREIRYNVLLYGTKEPLKNIFVQKSILNLSPLDTVMFSPSQVFSQRSYVVPVYGYKVIAQFNELGDGAMMPSIAIDRKSWSEDKKLKGMLRIDGGYFFYNQNLRGWLSESDLRGYRWMQPRLERSPINIFDSDNHHPVAVIVIIHPKSKIKPYFKDGKVYFNISIRVQGYLDEFTDDLSEIELEEKAANQIKEEVRYSFKKGLQIRSDVLKLEEALYRNYPKRFHELKQDDELLINEDSLKQIDVKVKLLHTGKYKGRGD
ncbi:Ger(x)C family spore germination protein [Paenibacillus sp. NPDC056579]|uniref:Ger(x)C family spore germination protein n=1 Tax=Paenibacillus sp. NPDC056579 TaxID=3345871 RepID=UPI0036B50A75